MSNQNDTPKPAPAEQPSPSGLDETTCCVSSEGNRRQQKMRPKILEAMDQLGGYECAKGYLRYEMMRTLNLRTLHDLHDRNMQGERMDDMIDALIVDGSRSLKSSHNASAMAPPPQRLPSTNDVPGG